MDISGKVAIVTGGAGGIGKAMIEILLQKNAKVCSGVRLSTRVSFRFIHQLMFLVKKGFLKIR